MKHSCDSPPSVPRFPKMCVVSFSYSCNAGCPNCPYNNSDVRKTYNNARFISNEVFNSIVRQCKGEDVVVRITGGGEPLLHPMAGDLICGAARQGIHISIITNGSVDVTPYLDVVNMIEFSADAGTSDEYSVVRKGLDWEFLNSNVKNACKYGGKTSIVVSIIDQKGVDTKRAEDHWSFVDKVQQRRYLTWGYNADNAGDNTPYLTLAGDGAMVPCPWIFERMNIDTRGNVTFCGEDIAFKHAFTNICDRSIQDVWLGNEFSQLRKVHVTEGGNAHPLCAGCPDHKYRSWQHNYWKVQRDATKKRIDKSK